MVNLDRLTFTRFLAALGIVIFHFGGVPRFQEYVPLLVGNGYILVSYFYCLSGFIMAAVYSQDAKNSGFSTLRYWLARFARIYPVYLLALLLMAPYSINTWPAWLLSIFAVQAWIPSHALCLNAPGWSISCEMFFYALFPLVLPFLREDRLKTSTVFILLIWVASQVFVWAAFPRHAAAGDTTWHNILSYMPILHLNQFLFGAVIGAWSRPFEIEAYPARIRKCLWFLMIPALFCAGFFFLRPYLGVASLFYLPMENGFLAPTFLFIILWLINGRSRYKDLLTHPWLILLGEASYSLYILQYPAWQIWQSIINSLQLSHTAAFFSFVPLLVALSLVAHLIIENPLRQRINSLFAAHVRATP